MALSKRCFYHSTISDFLKTPSDVIRAHLVKAHFGSFISLTYSQDKAWIEEISIMKQVLGGREGHVCFEYNIPRMGRRIDVVVLLQNIVFILEFKAFQEEYTKHDIMQVCDYGLDLKNFHEESHHRFIVPILMSTHAKSVEISYSCSQDRLFLPILSNAQAIPDIFNYIIEHYHYDEKEKLASDEEWVISKYSPTPTIVEAASALYLNHSVEEISRHDSGENLVTTSKCVSQIINDSKKNNHKSICFVTGVPGAGKTLVGLNIATEQFKKNEIATYLSGNFPLVEVLTEALARDKVALERTTGNRYTKTKARSEVKTFIQMIHHYRDACLEGTKVQNDQIIIDEDYFSNIENKEKHFIPKDHVAIFDESQRAWTKEQLANFMAQKKSVPNFPYSEPEYLISCLDRHQDWAVIVCLVGGGQEINTGEAGIEEWIKALNRNYPDWHVYISDQLTEQEYGAGRVQQLLNERSHVTTNEELHLSVSMRSFRAENVSKFVHCLLEREKEEARETLKSLENYPIYLTRNINTAKSWLKRRARGSERYGIVASSSGDRLRPEDIVVRLKANVVHWFLDDESDVRSSLHLEDVATEFDVQGLELDWCCVAWDGDFRYADEGWRYFQFNGGYRWNNVNQEVRRMYRKNAYRVLLTRARQGLIIFVPQGDANDPTRLPEFYDSTFNYLKDIGLKVI